MRPLSLISIFAVLLCFGILFFFFVSHDFASSVHKLINVNTPPLLFLVLMAFLPSLGFPLSAFLVLSGIKFGITGGLFAAALLIPVHMLTSFLITHSFLRVLVQKVLKSMNYSLPKLPAGKVISFTIFFMGIPGPPYVLKNYILAFSGVPLRYYLGLGWPVNFLLGIPFVGLGASAMEMDPLLFAIFLFLFLLIFLLIRWLKKKYIVKINKY